MLSQIFLILDPYTHALRQGLADQGRTVLVATTIEPKIFLPLSKRTKLRSCSCEIKK